METRSEYEIWRDEINGRKPTNLIKIGVDAAIILCFIAVVVCLLIAFA